MDQAESAALRAERDELLNEVAGHDCEHRAKVMTDLLAERKQLKARVKKAERLSQEQAKVIEKLGGAFGGMSKWVRTLQDAFPCMEWDDSWGRWEAVEAETNMHLKAAEAALAHKEQGE